MTTVYSLRPHQGRTLFAGLAGVRIPATSSRPFLFLASVSAKTFATSAPVGPTQGFFMSGGDGNPRRSATPSFNSNCSAEC